MEIHILLAGVEFGPYTDDKARQLLDEGFLSASDPAKRLDETDWVPLVELLEAAPVGATGGSTGSGQETATPPHLDAGFRSLAAALAEDEPEEFHAPLPLFGETPHAPTAESLWTEPEEETAEAAPEPEAAAFEASAEPESSVEEISSAHFPAPALEEEAPAEEAAPEPEAEAANEPPPVLPAPPLAVTRPSFPAPPITRSGATRPATASLPQRPATESKTQSLSRARRAAEKALMSTPAAPKPASEDIKSSFAAALAKTRSISTETTPLPAPPRTAGLPPAPEPLPQPPAKAAKILKTEPIRNPITLAKPEPSSRAATAPRPSAPSAPTSPGRGAAYVTSSIRAAGPSATSTSPLDHLVPAPVREKKPVVTGSLLAKEALQRARDRSGILAPTRVTTRLAPSADFEPETAPLPRKRTPVVLNRDDAAHVETPAPPPPAAPARKAIRLTGAISLPGGVALPPAPAEAKVSPPEPPPPRPRPELRPPAAPQPEPPQPPEARENDELTKTSSRKTIKLSGPISLPGRSAQPPPPGPGAASNETGPLVVRFSRPGLRKSPAAKRAPMVASSPAVAPQPSAPAPLAAGTGADLSVTPPSVDKKPLAETTRPAPVPPTAAADQPAPPPVPPPLPVPAPLTHPAELAAAAAVAAEEALAQSAATNESDLTESGHLVSSGSLRVTGALRPPPPPRLPVRLSSPSGEAGLASEGSVFEAKPAAPVPEEELIRPPTGKIAVHEMPTEGVKVRSRRITTKIPLPAAPSESIAAESPARRLPPPLPKITEAPEPAPPVAAPAEPAAAAETMAVAPPASPETSPPAAATPPGPEAEAAKPEKVRLRRPVKLELSSRKIDDSGRLTLEAFSKMAQHDLPTPVLAVVEPPPTRSPLVARTATAEPTELTAASMAPVAKAEAAPKALANPALVEPVPASEYSSRKLNQAPPVAWSSGRQKATPFPLEWIFYGIIALGVLAFGALVYLFVNRHVSSAPTAETAQTAMTAAPAATVTPPASASPPAVPESAAPPPSVTATTSNAAPAAASLVPAALPAPVVTSTSPAEDAARQAGAYVSDGILKYQHGDLDGAISAYNQALSLQPKLPEAFYRRGIAKAARDDPDGAMADYSQAIDLDPNMAPAYYYRGLARNSKLDLDGAISDYNEAVRLDPKSNALVFINRGLIRMQRDDLDGAIVDATSALEIDPHLIQAYYYRGLGRLAKGALDGALSDMKTYTQLATGADLAFADYARLYTWLIATQEGQLADANKALSDAMNSGWNAKAGDMVTRIGEFLLDQISESDLIKASASTDALKDQGQRCEAWYFIGMRKLQSGDRDGAADALQKCVDTQKTDYCEYILAQEQLKRMGAAPAVSEPPPVPRAAPAAGLPDPGTMAPAGH